MRQAKVVSAQEADEKAADAEFKLAALHSAEAEVSRLEDLVGFARITAPFDGVVTSRRTDIGQLVVAGSGIELFRVAQTRTLRVFVRLPQSLSSSARPGVVAHVLLSDDGGSPRRVEARLVRTSGAVDPASRTLLTELELPNADGAMLPGGFAQVEFPDASTNQALAIPANTLLFRPEGLTVAVVDAANTVEMRRIVPGRDLGALVEVLSGIAPDSRLVLNPPDSLATGMQVRLAAGGGTKAVR
jgi:RND family efflux transporter MFP subunit